jgi:hypothetical protein
MDYSIRLQFNSIRLPKFGKIKNRMTYAVHDNYKIIHQNLMWENCAEIILVNFACYMICTTNTSNYCACT